MRIRKILSRYRNDFTATMVCEHCGHTAELTSGYSDAFYHERVIPAMRCTDCGKNRAGDAECRPQALDPDTEAFSAGEQQVSTR